MDIHNLPALTHPCQNCVIENLLTLKLSINLNLLFYHHVLLPCNIGTCLYLPAFWHHEVQSLPADGMNIAVNFWFKEFS